MKHAKFAIAMHITAIITGVLLCLFAVCYVMIPSSVFLAFATTFGTTFYHIIMRLIVGALVPDHFCWQSKWFQPLRFEARLYRLLRVKCWKKQLPTYNPSLFSLKGYSLEQIICHTCQAEVVHEIIVVCSLIPLLFSLVFGEFFVFLITSLMAAVFDLLFVILQRFNRPRLIRILLARERRSGIV